MLMFVDGVVFKIFGGIEDFTEQEARNYISYILANTNVKNTPLVEVTVKTCSDGKVDVGYLFKGEKFERLRRITGYLTSDLRSWNDSKQAEERERVKHTAERLIFNA